MKRYFSFFALSLSFIFLFASCGGGGSSSQGNLSEIDGGKYSGGIFRYNESEYFRNLFPPGVVEVVGSRIISQTMEGLVMFDMANLSIQPCLAEKWDISKDGKTFTFHLRQDVFFHDDACFPDGKGKQMKASDVKFTLDRMFSASTNGVVNQAYNQFKGMVKGGDAHYQASLAEGWTMGDGVEGIRVLDDFTVEVELNQAAGDLFLNKMALQQSYIYPPEFVEHYGRDIAVKCVGTGPFTLGRVNEKEVVQLLRNPNYWAKDDNGNALPYLSEVHVQFIADQKTELLAFRNGELELQYKIPLEMRNEVLNESAQLTEAYADVILQAEPSLTIQYYGMLNPGKIFKDEKVRKAFNYAIDRESIVQNTLNGDGIPAHHGIVPPCISKNTSYDATSIKGYHFDPAKARTLLKEAGYANGEGFPKVTLYLNSGGKRNSQIAEALLSMLRENLNIDVEMQLMEWAQLTEKVEAGEFDFYRLGWIADYPDPENFLQLFWGIHTKQEKTYLNSFRFNSPEFDALYERALITPDQNEKMNLLQRAEQIAMDAAPILPIYYAIEYRLLQPYVRNFPQNAMEYRNLREVYLVPAEGAEGVVAENEQ